MSNYLKLLSTITLVFITVLGSAQVRAKDSVALPIDTRFSICRHIPLSNDIVVSSFSSRSCGFTYLMRIEGYEESLTVHFPFVIEAISKDDLDRIWVLCHDDGGTYLIQLSSQLDIMDQKWIPFQITGHTSDIQLYFNGHWGVVIDHQCWIQDRVSDHWIQVPLVDEVVSLIPAPSKEAWMIQTAQQLYVMDGWGSYRSLYKDSIIRSVVLDVSGDVWILGMSQLVRFDRVQNIFEVWAELQFPYTLYKLCQIGDELVLLASHSHLLWQQMYKVPNSSGGNFESLEWNDDKLPLFFPETISWNWEFWMIGYNQYSYEIRKMEWVEDMGDPFLEDISPSLELTDILLERETIDSLYLMFTCSIRGLKEIPLTSIDYSIGNNQDNYCSISQWHKSNGLNYTITEDPRIEFSIIIPKSAVLQEASIDLEIMAINGKVYYHDQPLKISVPFAQLTSIRPHSVSQVPKLSFYPNPIQDLLYVSGIPQKGYILLQSMDNRQIKIMAIQPNQTVIIDTSDMVSGQYILHYQSRESTTSSSAIVVKQE